MAILEIKELTVSFGTEAEKIIAADKVNLSVNERSWTAIVGESGSGKSVTALSVCRLIRPREISGAVYWHGGAETKNLLELPEKELCRIRGRDIAYVFQDPVSSLNPVIKIGEQIGEAFVAHFDATQKEAERRAKESLSAVQIKDVDRVYESFPHELSGGMNQRAMIAMALIGDPKLLIADEPTTALDVSVEFEIMRLLLDIQKEKSLSVLFITHNLGLAAAYAGAIDVMQKGQVVEHLERKEGKFYPKADYTQKLFRASFYPSKTKSRIEV